VTIFSPLVRRSVLLVPILDRSAVEKSWRHGSDVVALDLTEGVSDFEKGRARSLCAESLELARRGGAEVFVQVNRGLAFADIRAAARPGLSGIMLPDADSAEAIHEIDLALTEAERNEGLTIGELEIFLVLTSPKAIWNIHQLLLASERVTTVGIDEPRVCAAMGVMPRDDFDPLLFGRGRVIVETLAAFRLPIGMAHPLSSRPREEAPEELLTLATRARNTGFKGTICPYESWVEPCNRAYTPTDEQIDYYREVRAAFAEGVERGTAAVPFRGRMLDVPVDERAKDMIALWERCRRRDAEKAAALRAIEVS
jgi:citrate lyase subunit beta / citryl-CoA lyase